MGWKQFFRITSSDFQALYNAGQRWGTLTVYRWIVDSQTVYGAGWYYNSDVQGDSPKISITYQSFGTKQARITTKFLIIADPNSSGKLHLVLIFMKNGDWAAPAMPVVEIPVSNTSSNYVASLSQLTWVINEKTLSIYDANGNKLTDFTLSDYAQSFVVRVHVMPSSGWIGLMVYEVTGEYYDQFEDLMNQIMSMMNIMLWVMLAVMIISAIIAVFRRRKGGETE
jgi:hypothetical protein